MARDTLEAGSNAGAEAANAGAAGLPADGRRRVSFTVTDELWRVLQDETAREGIALADYARESVLLRLSFERGRRDALRLGEALRDQA